MPRENTVAGLEQFVEALEQMAFISPLPSGPGVPVPASPRLVQIECNYPEKGVVRLVADESFGAMLASNLLMVDPTSEEALKAADDALRELVNITCGAVIRSIGVAAVEHLQMMLPTVRELSADEWAEFLNSPRSQILDADGHVLAFQTSGLEAA